MVFSVGIPHASTSQLTLDFRTTDPTEIVRSMERFEREVIAAL